MDNIDKLDHKQNCILFLSHCSLSVPVMCQAHFQVLRTEQWTKQSTCPHGAGIQREERCREARIPWQQTEPWLRQCKCHTLTTELSRNLALLVIAAMEQAACPLQ